MTYLFHTWISSFQLLSSFYKSQLVQAMAKIINCAFCGGKGKDPFVLPYLLSECQVCRGTGTVVMDEPLENCVFCSGTGRNPLSERFPCIVCGGTGNNECAKKHTAINSNNVICGVEVSYCHN